MPVDNRPADEANSAQPENLVFNRHVEASSSNGPNPRSVQFENGGEEGEVSAAGMLPLLSARVPVPNTMIVGPDLVGHS